MSEAVLCIATFVAKPGFIDKLSSSLGALIEPTRREKGCLSYVLYRGLDNPHMFTMVETYTDKASFDFHGQQPYLEKFKTIVGEYIETVSVNLYKTV